MSKVRINLIYISIYKQKSYSSNDVHFQYKRDCDSMANNSNGINMLDVKKRNRSSVLKLIHTTKGISRKEIAAKLKLTPAAITLITTDLINEGILIETTSDQTRGKKGRKEITMEINSKKYAAVGVYISQKKFRIVCIDLDNSIIFEDTVYTDDCHNQAVNILDKVCDVLTAHLLDYNVLKTRQLLGIGISILGIVKAREGISVTSYGIFEDNFNVTEYVQKKLNIPVLLTNNICALAHGESFFTRSLYPSDQLFIKYGPGVGCAKLNDPDFYSVFDYKSVELGHLIVDPNGIPCFCGNQGCLETIVSYDAIEHSIQNLISRSRTPKLYALTGGKPENICMDYVMQAYDEGDPVVVTAINRTVFYLTVAIKNAVQLLNPKIVVLYGELFENTNFKYAISNALNKYIHTCKVTFSHFNLSLEALGPAATIISYFFENGGLTESNLMA